MSLDNAVIPRLPAAGGGPSIYHGHYRFQYLSAAFELGLFRVLHDDPGSTRTDIARRLGLDEQPARVLLLGCCAYGLIQKDGDRYYNTELSAALATTPDQIPGAFVPFQQHIAYRAMSWFCESLKANTNVGLQRELPGSDDSLYGRLTENGLETTFHNMMGSLSRLIAAELCENLDLSDYTHLLDVGGGTAVNAMSLARRWPHLNVTIIDLPTVVGTATERIAAAGFGDRVRAVGVDAFKDEFPTGCDCILFAHFLELWSPHRIRSILAKAARAVATGSGVFVVSAAQNDDETGPERAAWLSAYFLTVASGEGMVYTPREHEQWLDESGFTPGERRYLDKAGDVVVFGIKK
jgi:ubiquinone/menaquinone biosynthesis C-methylase UbiE